MRRPSLTPSVVRGLLTISSHVDVDLTDYAHGGRDGTHELWKACAYLINLRLWYQQNHPDFDVSYETLGAAHRQRADEIVVEIAQQDRRSR